MEQRVAFEHTEEYKAALAICLQEELKKAVEGLEPSKQILDEALARFLENPGSQELQCDFQKANWAFVAQAKLVSSASQQLHCNHSWRFQTITLRCYEGKCSLCRVRVRFPRPFTGRISLAPQPKDLAQLLTVRDQG